MGPTDGLPVLTDEQTLEVQATFLEFAQKLADERVQVVTVLVDEQVHVSLRVLS